VPCYDTLRPGIAAFGLTLLAVLYSLALLVSLFTIPEVNGKTLYEYGGSETLLIFVQPLLVSIAVWALLRRFCTKGGRITEVLVTAFVWLYLAYSFAGGFTISAGAMPAAFLLVIATQFTPRGSTPPAESPL
jgi:hypothetical protein